MGRRSWIHKLKYKQEASELIDYIDNYDDIFIVGAAIIDGSLSRVFNIDIPFGKQGVKYLALLTQSDGSYIIDKMCDNGIIKKRSSVTLLSDLNRSELKETKHGFKIKKAKYLSDEEFEAELKKLD